MKAAWINAFEGFIGDYFSNITAGTTHFTASVGTYDDGHNRGQFSSRSWQA